VELSNSERIHILLIYNNAILIALAAKYDEKTRNVHTFVLSLEWGD
jgi:hypothetical protein